MSKSIGIKLADGSFYPVLEEGVPDKKRMELTTVKDNQETVQVDLYRSETNSMEDAEYVDSLQIENLIARPNGEPTLAFNIALDENDNLSAEICDPESGEKSDISIKLVNRNEDERDAVPNFDLNTDTIETNGEPVADEEIFAGDITDEPVVDETVTEETSAEPEKHGGLLAAAAALGTAAVVGTAVNSANESNETISDEIEIPSTDSMDSAFDDIPLEEPASDTDIISSDLPDIDFNETVPLDTDSPLDTNSPLDTDNTLDTDSIEKTETATTTEMSDTTESASDDNMFDLPDFDNIDLDKNQNTMEDSLATDPVFAETDTNIQSAVNDYSSATENSDGLSFSGLYDKETLEGTTTSENAVRKTKKHVVICVICAIICIIATLLVLFVIPSKLNLVKGKSKGKETPIVLEPKPVESVEKTEKPAPVPEKKQEISPAKENEVVVAPTPNVVPAAPVAKTTKKENIRYKIRWGDTLWDISESYYKTPWKYKKIANYNKIKNPDHIISGTTIIIPVE